MTSTSSLWSTGARLLDDVTRGDGLGVHLHDADVVDRDDAV
jgi:hypothetical protein